MKLTRRQQNKLLEWAAEGLRLTEINERAEVFDPPFEVTWSQLKHARTRVSKRFSELREEDEACAIGTGLARGGDRIRELPSFVEKRKKQNKSGFVYVIGNRSILFVKIGFSKNPEERLRQLQVASGLILELLATKPGSRFDESEMHFELSRLRQIGEWFRLDSRAAEFLRKQFGVDLSDWQTAADTPLIFTNPPLNARQLSNEGVLNELHH